MRDKSSSPETPLDILGGDYLLERCGKGREEIFLSDISGTGLYLQLDLFPVRLFKRAKAPDIERLENM